MYIVWKRGVYGHGVHYVSESKDLAIDAAKRLAENDVDDYHEWQVFDVPVEIVPHEEARLQGYGLLGAHEADNWIFSIQKGKNGEHRN